MRGLYDRISRLVWGGRIDAQIAKGDAIVGPAPRTHGIMLQRPCKVQLTRGNIAPIFVRRAYLTKTVPFLREG